MKLFLILVLFLVPLLIKSQTPTRQDAGLSGSQGAVSGFFEANAPVNFPNGAQNWWHLLDIRHSNIENNFAMQFSGSFFDQYLYFRKTNNNASQPWSRILTETNGTVAVGSSNPVNTVMLLKVAQDSKPSGISLPSKSVLKFERSGTPYHSFHEFAEFRIAHGGPSLWGSKLDLYVNGVSNTTDVPDQQVMTWQYNGNVGIGTDQPEAKLQIKGGGLAVGSDIPIPTKDGNVSIGNIHEDSYPGFNDVINNTTLMLNANNFSTIGFHDSGNRIDFIRGGDGKIELGYDAGWGKANIGLPNGIWNAAGNVGIGTINPTEKLVINGNLKMILDEGIFPDKNVLSIVSLGYSGITGAKNWAMRSVYQHHNGVNINQNGGDLDIIKSFNGCTILATKTDGTALGNVGIGIINPNERLAVNGRIRAKEIKVETANWPDYVFKPDYKLPSLKETEAQIKANGHLPGMPSAKDVETNGLALGEMLKLQQKKIEELTLYIIELKKESENHQKQINQLKRNN